METLRMAQARDGFGGVRVAPIVIGSVEGCEMVRDQVCMFEDIR